MQCTQEHKHSSKGQAAAVSRTNSNKFAFMGQVKGTKFQSPVDIFSQKWPVHASGFSLRDYLQGRVP